MTRALRAIVWPGMPDQGGIELAAERIGRRVEATVISSNEDLERLLAEDGPWDLITPSDYLVEKLGARGELAEIDPGRLLDRTVLAGWARNPVYDPDERYSWPLAFGTTGYLYDGERVERHEGWRDFFRPEPGVEVGLLSEVREVVGAALIMAGHSPNSAEAADLEDAAAVLAAQREAVASVSSDDFTGPVEQGWVAMHHAWSGPAAMAVRRRPGLGYTVPDEGALLWVTTAAIPADAPEPDAAHDLLTALTRPEIARLAVENGGYSTPHTGARALLAEELRLDPVLFPSDEVIARCETVRPLSAEGELAVAATWP